MDANDLVPVLRSIRMGREPWVFRFLESAVPVSCTDIILYIYLTDLLLRVGDHPAGKVTGIITAWVESPLY